MKHLILIIFILLAIPLSAGAQDQSTPAAPAVPPPVLPILGISQNDAYPLRETSNNKTVSSVDGIELHLNDGQTIDLAGIWIPQSAGYAPSDEQVNAKLFLDQIFADQSQRGVVMYQTPISGKGRVTRLGHELAHVTRKAGNVWLQGALIANGLAQAWPTPSNPELAEKMYALEDEARAAGKGLWAKDSAYRLVTIGDDIPNLDRFAIAEGVVSKISMVNNVVYLNFGPDWKSDFTIGIQSPVRQVLGRNQIDVMKLQGQRVRVRGWIRHYNGPYMELESAILLQTLDQRQQNNIMPGAPQLSTRERKAPTAPITRNAVEEGDKNNAP